MKMKLISFCSALLIMLSGFVSQAQTKIGDVSFPDSYTAGKEKLVLNGGGTREKYWMDMYAAGLYLPSKSKDANSIISANSTMAIKISIISGLITSAKMIGAVEDGFKKSTGGKTEAIKDKIEKFKKAFNEPIKVGDVFDIIYSGEKISIYKGTTLKAEIEGLDFKKAVFGIWLGKEPVDSDLKEGMLGAS